MRSSIGENFNIFSHLLFFSSSRSSSLPKNAEGNDETEESEVIDLDLASQILGRPLSCSTMSDSEQSQSKSLIY